MIKLSLIRKTLVKVFEDATDVKPFIFEDQAGPRPKSGNYGTIKVAPVQFEGQDSERYEQVNGGDDIVIYTEGQRELEVSVNIYRDNAVEIMMGLQSLIESRPFKERVRLEADKRGQPFGLIDALTIQDLSELVNSEEYEERAQMDVRIRAASIISEKVSTIGEVTLDGTVENIAGEQRGAGKLIISED